jgi:hypothetical protein
LAFHAKESSGTSASPAPPKSVGASTVSPATRLPTTDSTRPAALADGGDQRLEPNLSLEDAFSDLETALQKMDRRKPKAGLASRSAPSDATSGVVLSEAPSKLGGTRPGDDAASHRKQRRPASVEVVPGLGQTPVEVPAEFTDLLNEFYPYIQTGSHPTEALPSSPRGWGLECPGCGREIGKTPGRLRCFRCRRLMCADCCDHAARGKRTLLCRSCFASYGVGYPDG